MEPREKFDASLALAVDTFLAAYEERNRGDSSCSLKKEVRKKDNEPEEGLFSV